MSKTEVVISLVVILVLGAAIIGAVTMNRPMPTEGEGAATAHILIFRKSTWEGDAALAERLEKAHNRGFRVTAMGGNPSYPLVVMEKP